MGGNALSRSRLIACESLAATQPNVGNRGPDTGNTRQKPCPHRPSRPARTEEPKTYRGKSGRGSVPAPLLEKGCSLHPIPSRNIFF